MQQVIKLSPTKFNVSWSGRTQEKDKIVIDFEPIIDYFQLSGDFVLIHWQSRPFGLRRWGAYDSFSHNYYPFDYDKINLNFIPIKLLQRPEIPNVLPPSAVILFSDCRLIIKEDFLEIKKI